MPIASVTGQYQASVSPVSCLPLCQEKAVVRLTQAHDLYVAASMHQWRKQQKLLFSSSAEPCRGTFANYVTIRGEERLASFQIAACLSRTAEYIAKLIMSGDSNVYKVS